MGASLGTLFPLPWRLWLGKLLFRPLDRSIVRVSLGRVVKGPCDPPEVEAMQFIASHTKIPIPKLFAVHTLDKQTYIEMEYIRGETLLHAWKRDGGLTLDQKNAIFTDIKQHITALRELEPPQKDVVSSAFQNPVIDYRVGFRFFGPMNQPEFQSLTRGDLRFEDVQPFLGDEVHKMHTTRYRTCFTHADLAARNIMVRDGRVVAIIDWAFSGWYPEYWEYTKARYDCPIDDDWCERLSACFPPYDMELQAEQILWTKLPEPGTASTMTSPDGEVYENDGSSPSAAWLEAREDHDHQDLWSLALLHV